MAKKYSSPKSAEKTTVFGISSSTIMSQFKRVADAACKRLRPAVTADEAVQLCIHEADIEPQRAAWHNSRRRLRPGPTEVMCAQLPGYAHPIQFAVPQGSRACLLVPDYAHPDRAPAFINTAPPALCERLAAEMKQWHDFVFGISLARFWWDKYDDTLTFRRENIRALMPGIVPLIRMAAGASDKMTVRNDCTHWATKLAPTPKPQHHIPILPNTRTALRMINESLATAWMLYQLPEPEENANRARVRLGAPPYKLSEEFTPPVAVGDQTLYMLSGEEFY